MGAFRLGAILYDTLVVRMYELSLMPWPLPFQLSLKFQPDQDSRRLTAHIVASGILNHDDILDKKLWVWALL